MRKGGFFKTGKSHITTMKWCDIDIYPEKDASVCEHYVILQARMDKDKW